MKIIRFIIFTCFSWFFLDFPDVFSSKFPPLSPQTVFSNVKRQNPSFPPLYVPIVFSQKDCKTVCFDPRRTCTTVFFCPCRTAELYFLGAKALGQKSGQKIPHRGLTCIPKYCLIPCTHAFPMFFLTVTDRKALQASQ